MATIYSDSFHYGKGHTDGDDVPFALAFQDVADDLVAVVARSDAAMQAKVDEIINQQLVIRQKLDSFVGNFTGHIAAAGVHQEADTTNSIDSPVATDVTADILTLLNNEAVKFDEHIINISGGIHGGVDSTNTLTELYPATDKIEAVALGANLYTKYEAHRVFTGGSVHGGADGTNTIAAAQPSDWDSLVTFCNEFKNTTGFNAHIALTGGSVHGADGSVDAVTADDCGVQKTALELELNEFKTDINGHIALLGVHPNAGSANSTTTATTEATSVAMVNGVKDTLNTHMASANQHQDADTIVIAGTATEYEDLLAVAAEVKAAVVAHLAKVSVHSKADAGNAETVVGAGGDVTVLGTGAAVTLKTINGGTR